MNILQPVTRANQTQGFKVPTDLKQIGSRLTPYLFLLPTLGMLTAFSLIPLVYGFWMSLHNINIPHGRSEFIGLQNYFNLLHDPKFGLSLLNTAGYTLAVVPSIVVVSLAIAIFLRKSTPARLFARVGFYIPFVLSPVVVATSWKWLLNEDLGVVDGFLKWAGIATVPWLTDDTAARISVVVTTVWNLVGFQCHSTGCAEHVRLGVCPFRAGLRCDPSDSSAAIDSFHCLVANAAISRGENHLSIAARHQQSVRVMHDVAAVVVCLIFLGPVLWAAYSANFQAVFASGDVPRYAFNSLLVAAISSLITIIASSMAGFALAKFKFPGRNLIFLVILATLLIPLQVLMVPVFLVLKTLGWVNQLIGIIVPPAATPTGTFMMRQFIRGIPDELIEAARLDGASDWKIYRHIILPLCAPMSAALGIISFTWRWNDYLWPLIVVNNQDKFTLQLSLANLVGTNTVEWGTLLAYAILVLIPVLIVFLLFQRLFLKGQVGAAIKG